MISLDENIETFNDNNDISFLFNSPKYTYNNENYSEELNENEELDLNNYESLTSPIENLENQEQNIVNENTTYYKTKFNLLYLQNKYSQKSLENQDKKSIFKTFEEIKNILSGNDDISDCIKEKLNYNKNIIEEKKYLTLLKKKKDREKDINNDENDNLYYYKNDNKKIKRGRKKSIYSIRNEHNRMASDNIIKKIKSKLFKKCIDFINKIINEKPKNKQGIKLINIDYKYINQLNREIDLNYLKSPLKDLFSKEISPKYKTKDKDFNKIIIENIINKEIDGLDYYTINFVFNLTFSQWIDLFLLKKDFDIFKKENEDNYEKVNFDKIKKSINGLNKFLDDEAKNKNNNENYFSLFVFYLYNYESFFLVKRPRNKKILI